MEQPLLITSTKNDRIKSLQKLEKSSERKEKGAFLIEGEREIQKAIRSGIKVLEVYFCPQIVSYEKAQELCGNNIPYTAVSTHVFEAVAYRENRDGIIAVANIRSFQLQDIPLSTSPLLIVLEAVEKPGNLGAILRTADATGADGVIVCDPKTDIYNPNVIRSSIGCVFTTPVATCSNHEAYDFLNSRKIISLATTPYTSSFYFSEDLTRGIAIVMGSEADGLSHFWLDHASKQTKIPMLGQADSLNVSACLAVVAYEAVRQRIEKKK